MQRGAKRMKIEQKTEHKIEQITCKWKAKKSGAEYAVTLTRPADDELCVISCENMKDARLECLKELNDVGFVSRDRTLSKATLPCGHSFAVLPLAYHFIKNNMRCPMCRAGEENTMVARCLPMQLRKAMTGHAAACRRQEESLQRQEDHNDNVAAIQHILASNMIQNYIPFTNGNFPAIVDMHVGIFTENNTSFCDFRITISLRFCVGSDGVYILPRCHFRDLCRHLRSCSATAVCLELTWEEFDICSSPLIHLPMLVGDNSEINPANQIRQFALTDYTTAMHTLDSQTGAQQRGQLVFDHPLIAGGQCDPFMPFSTVRWVPFLPELQATIRSEATRFAERYAYESRQA